MLCGESVSGQHPKCFTNLLRSEDRPVSLGSFSGGFSSTAGYVPGNEAHVRRLERRSTNQADHFLKALSVFIPITQVRLSADLGKPFGFGLKRIEQRHSAPATRELCVAASVPLPESGQEARKRSRLCSHITPPNF